MLISTSNKGAYIVNGCKEVEDEEPLSRKSNATCTSYTPSSKIKRSS